MVAYYDYYFTLGCVTCVKWYFYEGSGLDSSCSVLVGGQSVASCISIVVVFSLRNFDPYDHYDACCETIFIHHTLDALNLFM